MLTVETIFLNPYKCYEMLKRKIFLKIFFFQTSVLFIVLIFYYLNVTIVFFFLQKARIQTEYTLEELYNQNRM